MPSIEADVLSHAHPDADAGRVCAGGSGSASEGHPRWPGAGPLALEQGGGGEGKVVTCGVTVDVIWFHDHVFILHDNHVTDSHDTTSVRFTVRSQKRTEAHDAQTSDLPMIEIRSATWIVSRPP